jgi:DNA-directed RNA polymerase specialized sigma24 family protein
MRDVGEFDAFYQASARRVLGQVFAMAADRAAAEEAVTEAYARAWDRWSALRETDSPEAWIRQTASRLALKRARRSGGEDLDGLDLQQATLARAIRQLSADERRALVLYYLVGLTKSEIAREVGASESRITTWIARGEHALESRTGTP